MKNAKKIESNLCCKATASLGMEIQEELTKKDKSLGNLLDEQEKKDTDDRDCGCEEDCRKGC
jgi:hypothetical protein